MRRESIENKEDVPDPLATLSKREYEVFSMLVDGVTRSVNEVLDDPTMAQTISDEGPIPDVQGLLERTGIEQPCSPIKPGIPNPLDGVPRLPL